MNIIRAFVSWFLFTCLLTTSCAVGLCVSSEYLMLGHFPPLFSSLHLFIFGSALLVYNVHYILKRAAPHVSDRYDWSRQHMVWHYIMGGAGFVMMGLSALFLPSSILPGCIVLGMLSFAYSLPMLPFKDKKRIREIGWIKIMVLDGVWTVVTCILPMLYWHKSIAEYPYEILLRFVFLFTLCVAFDIRDMQTDLDHGVFTIPNLIGLPNSYRLMNIALALFAILSIFQFYRYHFIIRLIGALATALATRLSITYTRKHPSDMAYLLLIDGMMILYAVLVV